MLNILISSSDLNFICSIINNLTVKYDDLRIYNISISLKDTMKQLKYNKKNINLVIMQESNYKLTKFIKDFEAYGIPIFLISKELHIAKILQLIYFFIRMRKYFCMSFNILLNH